jgi:hypothetical protein
MSPIVLKAPSKCCGSAILIYTLKMSENFKKMLAERGNKIFITKHLSEGKG